MCRAVESLGLFSHGQLSFALASRCAEKMKVRHGRKESRVEDERRESLAVPVFDAPSGSGDSGLRDVLSSYCLSTK